MKSFLKGIFGNRKEKSDETIETIVLDDEAKQDLKEVDLADNMWAKVKQHRNMVQRIWLLAIGCLSLLLAGFLCYLFFHTSTSFSTISETARADISGTEYVAFGKGLIKYSPDGVSSITNKGEVHWNSTYSMQSPIVDVRGSTLAVAEKNGTQVYVYNEVGLLGQFQTALPIEKVRVASQGVVAIVLQDEEVTWVNLYDTKGKEIVATRTSVEESGYPIDIALAPDGLKMIVSYLRVTQGVMNTSVSFYNFGPVGQAEQNNMVISTNYENTVAPQVIFANTDTAIAFRNDGFSVFEGKQIPELKKEEQFEEEILSVFHDEDYFGFVFLSDKAEHKYRMQLYNMSGKKVAEKYFDLDYKEIKLDRSKVVLYNEAAFEVYGTNGRLKYTGSYPKPIVDVISVKGFNKYMVLTRESTDLIRLK